MIVNGLILPHEFIISVQQGTFPRARGSWQLIQDIDAWGLPLETNLDKVYEDGTRISVETDRLTRDFPPDGLDGFDGPDPCEDMPGFIPYITDFSRIICFGVGSEDNPFCFDYRANAQTPEVIWWEDAFWRRIAPDWVSFAALFDLTEPALYYPGAMNMTLDVSAELEGQLQQAARAQGTDASTYGEDKI